MRRRRVPFDVPTAAMNLSVTGTNVQLYHARVRPAKPPSGEKTSFRYRNSYLPSKKLTSPNSDVSKPLSLILLGVVPPGLSLKS